MSAKAGIEAPVSRAGGRLRALRACDEGIEAPFALVDLDAMWANGGRHAPAGRGQADPGRVQVGPLPAAAGAHPRARPWLPGPADLHAARDAVARASRASRTCCSAYPTADRTALAELARLTDERPGRAGR